ncbi:MAG: MBL fold metallo-hydrolase [Armatimonadetes bacterium]|nr:MBL fold metallo-hydrolase [Armatimonadota bacterium]
MFCPPHGIITITAPNPSLTTLEGTNTYLIGRRPRGEMVVIDPGPDSPIHREVIFHEIRSVGGRVSLILLTHSHPDHAAGALALSKALQVPVCGFPGGAVPLDRELSHGAMVEIEGFSFRCLHTPGHARDHLCFVLSGKGIVLTGDLVLGRGSLALFPPEGDLDLYRTSLSLLLTLDEEWILPGHGPPVPLKRTVEEYLRHRQDRENQIKEALALGCSTVDEVMEWVYRDLDPALYGLARGTVEVHLASLMGRGGVVLEDGRYCHHPG